MDRFKAKFNELEPQIQSDTTRVLKHIVRRQGGDERHIGVNLMSYLNIMVRVYEDSGAVHLLIKGKLDSIVLKEDKLETDEVELNFSTVEDVLITLVKVCGYKHFEIGSFVKELIPEEAPIILTDMQVKLGYSAWELFVYDDDTMW